MFYTPKNFTYLGIDESTLSVGNTSLIVVAAETNDKKLIKPASGLEKAGRILHRVEGGEEIGIPFPTLGQMKDEGLADFHWTRASRGRFTRQQIEHAAIAHLIARNGYQPERTLLLIDTYSKPAETAHLIKECLHQWDFPIDEKNIQCHEAGDELIPIINYADMLAFQIGVNINKRYRQYFPHAVDFPIETREIPFDERRVITAGSEERDTLDEAIRRMNGK